MAIRISLGQVKDGINEFEMHASPGEIGIDEALLKDGIDINLSVEKVSNQLDLDVEVKGTMRLECDRCLEMFDKEFSSKFELVYVVEQFDGKIENDDYVRPYSPHMRYIDITKDVKDFIDLAVPMRRVPGENGDGSCSWCGKSREYWNNYIVNEGEEE